MNIVNNNRTEGAGRHSTEILPGMFPFAYEDKNGHRNSNQNNNANYEWVHVIRTECPGKNGIANMLRNSLTNRHIRLHNTYSKAREDKPFQFSRIPWHTQSSLKL